MTLGISASAPLRRRLHRCYKPKRRRRSISDYASKASDDAELRMARYESRSDGEFGTRSVKLGVDVLDGSMSVGSRALRQRRKYDPRRYMAAYHRLSPCSYFYSSKAVSVPPRGYLWIWMGHFKRWQWRHFSLDAPGVMTYVKSPDGGGRRRTILMRDAAVVVSKGNARQFALVTRGGQVVHLRTSTRKERTSWATAVQKSAQSYKAVLQGTAVFQDMPEATELTASRLSPWSLSSAEVSEKARTQKEHMARLRSRMAGLMPYVAEVRRQMEKLTDPSSDDSQRQGVRELVNETVIPIHQISISLSTESDSRDSSGDNCDECRMPRRLDLGSRGPAVGDVAENEAVGAGPLYLNGSEGLPIHHAYEALDSLVGAVKQILSTEFAKVLELEAELVALHGHLLRAQDGWQAYPQAQVDLSNCVVPDYFTAAEADNDLESDNSKNTGGLAATSDSYSTAGSFLSGGSSANEDDFTDQLVCKCQDIVTFEGSVAGLQEIVPEEPIEDLKVAKGVTSAQEGKPASSTDWKPVECQVQDEERGNQGNPSSEDDKVIANLTDHLGARRCLPAPRAKQRGFSLWSILKSAIGRDLTRITMPSTINEPLSALQRLMEEVEYHQILRKAASCSTSIDRLLLVSAFAVSSYSSGLLRDNKPFNSLLGETFEHEIEGVRFLAEQVSHHPPVSCFISQGLHAETNESVFELYGELELRSKFWGRSVSVSPAGRCQLHLCGADEEFVWNKATISIHNIILGKLWLDIHGDILIENRTTGEYAKIHLMRCNGALSKRGNVEGAVYNSFGKLVYKMFGNFMGTVFAERVDEAGNTLGEGPSLRSGEVFRSAEPLENADTQYNMTGFAIALNDPRDAKPGELPCTDARFRPDVRALENGDFDLATAEKLRLEEKQRHALQIRKENGGTYRPMWFRKRDEDDCELVHGVAHHGPPAWEVNQCYWEHKRSKNWSECPDIY